MRKLLIALILISGLSQAQDWVYATIDSNATVSSVITLVNLHPVEVVVDTPWTAANLNIQVYDPLSLGYKLLKDESGSAIVLTITSPPASYRFKPIDAWAITDKFKLVSTSAQGNKRTLKIKRAKFD